MCNLQGMVGMMTVHHIPVHSFWTFPQHSTHSAQTKTNTLYTLLQVSKNRHNARMKFRTVRSGCTSGNNDTFLYWHWRHIHNYTTSVLQSLQRSSSVPWSMYFILFKFLEYISLHLLTHWIQLVVYWTLVYQFHFQCAFILLMSTQLYFSIHFTGYISTA
jgi:hypothetical protein